MLETEYSAFGRHYHTCWCPDSQSHQSISRYGIGYVGQTTGIVVSELISSTWVEPKPKEKIQNVNLYFDIFKTIQHVIHD